jgi:hypothetical protein
MARDVAKIVGGVIRLELLTGNTDNIVRVFSNTNITRYAYCSSKNVQILSCIVVCLKSVNINSC